MQNRILSIVLLLALVVSLMPPMTSLAEEAPAAAPEQLVQAEQPTETQPVTEQAVPLQPEPVQTAQEQLEPAQQEYPVEEPLGEIKSGSCGENVTWLLDSEAGVLTISGTGDMADYSDVWGIPWFQYRYVFDTVTVSFGVTSIGNHAFDNSNITSIEIPSSVTKIGDWAFVSSWKLANVVLPDSVTSIGEGAFYKCGNLTSLAIPEKVTHIGDAAFAGCGFSFISIPDGISSIERDTFTHCENLVSIGIPSSVITIGDYAFDYCTNLTTVYYGGDETSWNAISIGSGNESLNSAWILYDSNGIIGGECGENGVWYLDMATGVLTISGPECMNHYLTNYNEVLHNSVTSAPWGRYAAFIKTVVIDGGATYIGQYAFYGCTNLESVTLPDSLKSIGNQSFYGCSNLAAISIPNSVTSIGEAAFYGCTSLTRIEIPNNVTSIGLLAFEYCPSLTSITVAAENSVYDSRDNCNAIAETATNVLIRGCQNTVIPHSVTSIGNWAFSNCTTLTSIEIPNSVTDIGYSAFYNCSSLASIKITNRVTSIGQDAFENCTSLENIEIPNSVISVGRFAFSDCSNLSSVTIGIGATSIEVGTFAWCTSLTSVTISDSVTSIGNYAFRDCSSLNLVHFAGTEAYWNSISIGFENASLKNAPRHYLEHQSGSNSWYCPICDEYFYEEASEHPTIIAETEAEDHKITFALKEGIEPTPIFLAGYNKKGQLVGIYKATPKDGKYEIQTQETVQDLTWKVFFIDEKNCPKYMAHLLYFQ